MIPFFKEHGELVWVVEHGECIISVGIAPSKLRGIGWLLVIGGTAGHAVWRNQELNLIGQARYWRAVEKHRPTSD